MKLSDLEELVILLVAFVVWSNILFLEVPVVRITGGDCRFCIAGEETHVDMKMEMMCVIIEVGDEFRVIKGRETWMYGCESYYYEV